MLNFKELGQLYLEKQKEYEQPQSDLQIELDNLNLIYKKLSSKKIDPDENLLDFILQTFPDGTVAPTKKKEKLNLLDEAKKSQKHEDVFSVSENLPSELGSPSKMAALAEKPGPANRGSLHELRGGGKLGPQYSKTIQTIDLTNMVKDLRSDLKPYEKKVLEKKSTIYLNLDGDQMLNQYKFIRELGKGAFGKVELAINQDTNEEVAIKVQSKKLMKKKSITVSKETMNMLQKEIAIMKKLVSSSNLTSSNIRMSLDCEKSSKTTRKRCST